jgi:hypothetical protein
MSLVIGNTTQYSPDGVAIQAAIIVGLRTIYVAPDGSQSSSPSYPPGTVPVLTADIVVWVGNGTNTIFHTQVRESPSFPQPNTIRG